MTFFPAASASMLSLMASRAALWHSSVISAPENLAWTLSLSVSVSLSLSVSVSLSLPLSLCLSLSLSISLSLRCVAISLCLLVFSLSSPPHLPVSLSL